MYSLINILFTIFITTILGCSNTHTSKPLLVITQSEQVASLKTETQQYSKYLEALSHNKYTTYWSDRKQWEEGLTEGGYDGEYWSVTKWSKLKKLLAQVKSGITTLNLENSVKVDCEDTQGHGYMFLLDEGYPADQMYFNLYLAPQTNLTVGTNYLGSDMVGHAVLTLDIEGKIPHAYEDTDVPQTQYTIETYKGYYCIGFKPMTEDLRTQWYAVDLEGYIMYMNNEITLTEAKARSKYKQHTKYMQTVYHRRVKQ